MKIAVVGANTRVGGRLVLKAEAEGIQAVSVVSDALNLVGTGRVVITDYQDLLLSDLRGCHYVVDPLSFLSISSFSSDLLPLWRLLEILRGSGIRLLVLGSSAILYTDRRRETLVCESRCLIAETPPHASRLCVNAYKRLSSCDSVPWCVLCPPLLIDGLGHAAGPLEFADDVLPMGLDGDSSISEAGFAAAAVELLKRGIRDFKRVSVREVRHRA